MSSYETSRQESGELTTNHLLAEGLSVSDTGAGFLVYEIEREYREHLGREVEVARRLIGFADVTDWGTIEEAITARGHARGDALHLPEFDADELPTPTRV
jgi:5-methylthioribose kinase